MKRITCSALTFGLAVFSCILTAPGTVAAEPLKASKPLKVFILAGQSNMQGHANVSTFDYIGKDPKTAPMLAQMVDGTGKPRLCDKVWITYTSENRSRQATEKKGRLTAGFGARDESIGPEFTFGLYMDKVIDEPILIIKTGWGGKSLHTDFRPPSAAT